MLISFMWKSTDKRFLPVCYDDEQGKKGSGTRWLVSSLFDVCSQSTLADIDKNEEIRIPWGSGNNSFIQFFSLLSFSALCKESELLFRHSRICGGEWEHCKHRFEPYINQSIANL